MRHFCEGSMISYSEINAILLQEPLANHSKDIFYMKGLIRSNNKQHIWVTGSEKVALFHWINGVTG